MFLPLFYYFFDPLLNFVPPLARAVAADLAAAAAARDAASPILGSPGGAASTAPRWLVFLGHRPFYISSPYNTGVAGDGPAAEAMQAALEPLWAQARRIYPPHSFSSQFFYFIFLGLTFFSR